MISNANAFTKVDEIIRIIQSAGDENGWMSEEEFKRTQAALRELGVNVVITVEDETSDDDSPAIDEQGRAFVEVSIHPVVQQTADEHGNPVDGDSVNPSGSEFSDEFGDDLDGYPDAMFKKHWSVTSWVRCGDDDGGDDDLDYGEIAVVDDESFRDYQSAIERAEELASKYRVDVDHRY